MPSIKLFLMRHSKSCSNHTREASEEDSVLVSQSLRDPRLTVEGRRIAALYGPTLRARLRASGFDSDNCMVGCSRLGRARETAQLIFNRKSTRLPHFTENGAIPENTPTTGHYTPPDWGRFIAHLSTLVHEGQSVAVVGHGSFLGSLWPVFTGQSRAARLNNLDGILLDIEVSRHGSRVHGFQEIPCSVHVDPSADQCQALDRQKIGTLRRKMAQQQRQRSQKQRNQRGGNGCAGMPLAYFQDGAQMFGTSGTPTGVGLAGVTDGWVRAPMGLTGGSRRSHNNRRTQKQQQQKQRQQRQQRQQQQNGGFSASVMGAFASNGLRVLPGLAGYLGYKQYSNEQSSLNRSRRQSRSQARSSRRN